MSKIDSASLPTSFRRAMSREPALRQPGAPPASAGQPSPSAADREAGGHPARKDGSVAEKTPGRRRKVMNKTESAFAARLEADRVTGLISSWHFEGMTLRWGTLDSISYTADFLVFEPMGAIHLIEVKGGHLFKDTSQKFKAARNQWPQFRFEMFQRKAGEWKRLY